MSSSEPAVIQPIHIHRKDPGTTGSLCHCTGCRVLTVCPDLRVLGLFQLDQKCQLRCLGLSPGTQLHSSCLHFPFAFCWINYSSCCSLNCVLLLCMLKSCHISPQSWLYLKDGLTVLYVCSLELDCKVHCVF